MTGVEWTGIGHYNHSGQVDNKGVRTPLNNFLGIYDGKGNTIANITVAKDGTQATYLGAFISWMDNNNNAADPKPAISNLTVNVVSAGDGVQGFAAFVGVAKGVNFENCKATGTFSGSHSMGGFCVQCYGDSLFKDCVNEATITSTASKKVGGFIGQVQGPGKITGVQFVNCVNKGDVTAPGTEVGGIIGNHGANPGELASFESCSNEGTITGGQLIGSVNSKNIYPISGINTVKADALALGTTDTTARYDGFWFADKDAINDGKATLISTNDLVKGGTYKAFAKFTAGPVFTLAAEDDTIAFDLSLVGDDASFITVGAAAGLKAEKGDVTEHVVTFTAVKDLANYTVTLSFSDTEIKSATINETDWAGEAQTFEEGTAITVAAVAQDGYENVTYKIGDETITGGAFTLASNTVVTITATQKQQGWPDDPTVDEGKDAKTTFPNLPAAFEGADAGLVAAWAKKTGLAYADMADANIDAFLLDCAPDEVTTEAAKFKITKIEYVEGEWVVTVADEFGEGERYGNAKVDIVDVTDDFDKVANGASATKGFYQAKLVPFIVTK